MRGGENREKRLPVHWTVALTIMFMLACLVAAAAIGRMIYAATKLEAALGQAQSAATLPAPMPRDGRVRLVLFGDSRIVKWAPVPKIVGTQVLRLGRGGETTVEMSARAEAVIRAADPDILVLQGGINDLVAAGLNPGRAEVLMVDVVQTLVALAGTGRALGVQRVIIMTIVRPGRAPIWRWPFWSVEIPRLVERVNARLIRLAAAEGIEILDADRLLAGPGDGALTPTMALDTLHWRAEAYRRLNAALTDLL